MTRRARGIGMVAGLAATAALIAAARNARGAALDEADEISLGARAYTAARIGTEDTNVSICQIVAGKVVCGGQNGARNNKDDRQTYRNLTFPYSAAGHLRQHRVFAEVELKHRLDRLVREGFGPFALLNDLPFTFRKLGYNVTYRGEYEGIYDYGPSEYRTAHQYSNRVLVPCYQSKCPDTGDLRRDLRDTAVERQRLFQVFVEGEVGKLFFRLGRQILAWGETDAFRLLDNINPLDASFGGFLIPLDERRVPLDMLRASYAIGSLPYLPFYETYVEAFAAIDNAVSIEPGIPIGSPWQLPNFFPSAVLFTTKQIPATTVKNTRGGFQVKFNSPMPVIEEATFGIAHYYTYLDTPAVQTFVNPLFPIAIPSDYQPGGGYLALAVQSVPVVQITGATTTFAVPARLSRLLGMSGEPVVRSELAYFRGEPRFTQSQLDPFLYATGGVCRYGGITPSGLCTGNFTLRRNPDGTTTRVATGPRTADSWNFVLGLDLNQWVRFLNPSQTMLITTQFFYKHLNGAAKRRAIRNVGQRLPNQPQLFDGEVLPVPAYIQSPDSRGLPTSAAESVFIHNPVDQYLHTLLIATSYYSGQVTPALGFFYDWSGSVVVQPQLTLSRDPFRFSMSYSYLYASALKGASGISLLRDRDNVLFQLEYVI